MVSAQKTFLAPPRLVLNTKKEAVEKSEKETRNRECAWRLRTQHMQIAKQKKRTKAIEAPIEKEKTNVPKGIPRLREYHISLYFLEWEFAQKPPWRKEHC